MKRLDAIAAAVTNLNFFPKHRFPHQWVEAGKIDHDEFDDRTRRLCHIAKSSA
jgi:hypothetical protein